VIYSIVMDPSCQVSMNLSPFFLRMTRSLILPVTLPLSTFRAVILANALAPEWTTTPF